jgi:hypothetical protein
VLLRHAAKRLLPSAIRKSQSCAPADFEPYSLTAKHTVTLHTDAYISLYTDVAECADGLTVQERIADTWNLVSGFPMVLGDFLPGKKRRLGDIPSLKHLRPGDFYLAPGKVVLFLQPGTYEVTLPYETA